MTKVILRLLALGCTAALGLLSQPARAQTACMSLVSPDVLLCTDGRDMPLVCDVSGAKPACQTFAALYKSWRGHPERREEFYRRLYGAAK